MKLFKTTLCAAVATIAMTGAASAADFAFHVGGATDYVFRGIDQTGDDSEMQIFAGVDVTESAFYAGAWLSTVGYNFEGGEYDLYAGWKPTFGGATLDVGAIYYGYTRKAADQFNTLEFKVAGSYPVGPLTLGAAAYYSPDFADTDESSTYIEANAAYTLTDTITVSGAYGKFASDGILPDSYDTWNVGVTAMVTEHISLDGRYVGVSSDAEAAFGNDAFKGLVGTIKVSF